METAGAWAHDVLDRKPLAEYLTRSLKAQSTSLAAMDRGLTVALDADWGAGKSFFVVNWCDDLRAAGHPVVYFDAWENDIGDEAAISLMAAILSGLKACLPKNDLVAAEARELRQSSIKKLRRALMPAAGIVLKGILKKTTSIAVDELVEVFADSNEEEGENSSLKVDDVLDGLFEKSLLEHDSRKQELMAFKASLAELLNLACGKEKGKPLFVFVDELDRCRPSYAIKLLEEIKHIFGIKDVVYVVSTNIDQLQSSVRAVYGDDFDGRRYLRRLFNREYLLPKADGKNFAKSFIARMGWAPAKVELGLPITYGEKAGIADVWILISDAFGFDYRTQEQALSLAVEASGFITQGSDKNPLHVLWLFYLSALYYSSLSLLREIALASVSGKEMHEKIENSIKHNSVIEYVPIRSDHGRSSAIERKSLSYVICSYFDLGTTPSKKIFSSSMGNMYDYPSSIGHVLQNELGGYYDAGSPPFLSIHYYANLVLTSGYLVGPGRDQVK